jgi:hypothetical protein
VGFRLVFRLGFRLAFLALKNPSGLDCPVTKLLADSVKRRLKPVLPVTDPALQIKQG